MRRFFEDRHGFGHHHGFGRLLGKIFFGGLLHGHVHGRGRGRTHPHWEMRAEERGHIRSPSSFSGEEAARTASDNTTRAKKRRCSDCPWRVDGKATRTASGDAARENAPRKNDDPA